MADTAKRVERFLALVAQAKADVAAIQRHRLSSEPLRQADSLTLANCLAQPDRLRAEIKAKAGGDADDRRLRAQASVLQQSLALDIIAPLTIRLFTTGQAAIPDSRFIQLRPDADGLDVNNWHWLEHCETLAGIDEYAAGVAAQVNTWYPVFRQQLGVAPGAYWSSIGLALSAPFSTIYDRAPANQLCHEASDWLNSIDCDARRYIDWIAVLLNQQHCAIPQRRGCCLAFKLPGGWLLRHLRHLSQTAHGAAVAKNQSGKPPVDPIIAIIVTRLTRPANMAIFIPLRSSSCGVIVFSLSSPGLSGLKIILLIIICNK